MPSKKTRLNEALAGVSRVGPEEFAALRRELSISDGYLRRLLRDRAGLELHPLVEGVRQDSFASLERTLLAMPVGVEGRRLVLEAKRHARLALRSAKVDRAEREEMAAWMTVWLETPDVFPAWLALRKRARGG